MKKPVAELPDKYMEVQEQDAKNNHSRTKDGIIII